MINFNGSLVAKDQTLFKAGNRAFLYGDQLFETLRFHKGKILFWEEHYFRMMGAACMLRMDIPMHLNMDFFLAEVLKTVEANNINNHDARVRISLYRTDGGFYKPHSRSLEYVIEVEKLDSNQLGIGEGLKIDIFHDHKKPQETLSSLKGANSLPSVLSAIYAEENQLDEAVILNSSSEVCETTSANIFVLKNDVLYTPPLSSGCVDGIIRKLLLEKSEELDITIEEKTMKPFELIKADEVFITNSIKGIAYVKSYKNKEYANVFSAKLLKRLMELI